MKKSFLSILFTGAVILFLGEMTCVSAAMAGGDYSGAETYTRTFKWTTYGTDYNYTADGGQGTITALSSIVEDRGEAQAESTLGFAPILKAKAFHYEGLTGAKASAWAIQGYTYNGAASTTLELSASLTGSVYDPAESSRVGLFADICIFKVNNFGYYQDLGSLGEIGAQLIDGAQMNLGLHDTVTNGMHSDSIFFSLDPGQSFYLWSNLDATAINGTSWADAYSTLDLSFDDTTNLALGAASVPIPGAIWLFGSGLIGLIGFVRRQKN